MLTSAMAPSTGWPSLDQPESNSYQVVAAGAAAAGSVPSARSSALT